MLFRKKIDQYCTYCIHAKRLSDEQMACVKKGIVATTDSCRRFSYDPLKRVPPRVKPLEASTFDLDDFSL